MLLTWFTPLMDSQKMMMDLPLAMVALASSNVADIWASRVGQIFAGLCTNFFGTAVGIIWKSAEYMSRR